LAAGRALVGLDPTASPGGENREVGGLGVRCGAVQAAIEAADFLSTFVDWGLEPFHVGVSVEWDGSITAETFSRMAGNRDFPPIQKQREPLPSLLP
jgi:hypothetical protein